MAKLMHAVVTLPLNTLGCSTWGKMSLSGPAQGSIHVIRRELERIRVKTHIGSHACTTYANMLQLATTKARSRSSRQAPHSHAKVKDRRRTLIVVSCEFVGPR